MYFLNIWNKKKLLLSNRSQKELFEVYLFIFICIDYAQHTHMCLWRPQCIGFSGTRVTGSCELPAKLRIYAGVLNALNY